MESLPGFMKHSVQDAIRAVVELKRRIGKVKMSVVCKGQEFIRCEYGTTGTRVHIITAYVCQDCGHAPKYDFSTTLYSSSAVPGEVGIVLLRVHVRQRGHERYDCLQDPR